MLRAGALSPIRPPQRGIPCSKAAVTGRRALTPFETTFFHVCLPHVTQDYTVHWWSPLSNTSRFAQTMIWYFGSRITESPRIVGAFIAWRELKVCVIFLRHYLGNTWLLGPNFRRSTAKTNFSGNSQVTLPSTFCHGTMKRHSPVTDCFISAHYCT